MIDLIQYVFPYYDKENGNKLNIMDILYRRNDLLQIHCALLRKDNEFKTWTLGKLVKIQALDSINIDQLYLGGETYQIASMLTARPPS